jgi:hypothetical protein
MQNAMQAASKDPNRSLLNSVLLDGNHLVATDGKQLHCSEMEIPEIRQPLIIPTSPLWAQLTGKVDAGISRCGKYFCVKTENYTYYAKLKEGTYPNWRGVLMEDMETTYSYSLRMTSKTIQSILTDMKSVIQLEKKEVLALIVQKHQVTLHYGSPWKQLVLGDIEGIPESRVCFSYELLCSALQTGCNNLHWKDEFSPLLFTNVSSQHLIMPLRMTETDWNTIIPTTITPIQNNSPIIAPQQEEQIKPERKIETMTATTLQQPISTNPDDELKESLTSLRNLFSEASGIITNALKSLRDLQRESKEQEKEYAGLRRTLKSLQSVNI